MTREQLEYLNKLKEALEFFADEDNYKCIEHEACSVRNIPVTAIGLEIARKALLNED